MKNKKLTKDLLAKFHLGIATENEKQIIMDSEESDKLLMKQWENYDDIKAVSGEMDSQRLKKQLFQTINAQKKKENTGFRFLSLGRYAAAALITIFIAVIAYFIVVDKEPTSTANMLVKQNPKGMRSELVLSDGTKVFLNADSKISYPEQFSGSERMVSLEGEAYFDVVKNPDNPFVVKTQMVDIEVLGTSFDVKSFPGDKKIETTLVLGKLSVKRKNPQTGQTSNVILEPNQQAVFIVDQEKLIRNDVDAELFSSWTNGQLRVENESFAELTLKLERWYDVEIKLEPGLDSKYFFTLSISNETIEDILNLLKKTTPSLEITMSGKKIYIGER